VLAEGIRQIATGEAELVLDVRPRVLELALEGVVAEARQVRMADRVRADLDASLGELAQLVPPECLELRWGRVDVLAELGDPEGPPFVSEARADEDGRRDAQALEDRNCVLDAPVRVVERRVESARTSFDDVGGCARLVTAEQELQVRLERLGRDREPVGLRCRDAVVAEDERTGRAQRGASPKTSSTRASNERGSMPSASA
jgi:hypothetical protein